MNYGKCRHHVATRVHFSSRVSAKAGLESSNVTRCTSPSESANNLAGVYGDQKRYADALPLIQRTISHITGSTGNALPVLFGAQAAKLIPADKALDASLNVVQRALQTSSGTAVN